MAYVMTINPAYFPDIHVRISMMEDAVSGCRVELQRISQRIESNWKEYIQLCEKTGDLIARGYVDSAQRLLEKQRKLAEVITKLYADYDDMEQNYQFRIDELVLLMSEAP